MNIVRLDYTVTADKSQGNYYIFLSDQVLNALDLPIEIKDSMISFAAQYTSSPFTLDGFIGERLLKQIAEELSKVWNWEFGVPIVRFNGKVSQFSKDLQKRWIFPFFIQKEADIIEQFQKWELALHEVSQFTFKVPDQLSFLICDHAMARSWLRRQTFLYRQQKQRDHNQDMSVMHERWYGEDAQPMLAQAKEILEQFVKVKKTTAKIGVPTFFAVVPAFHIRRYYKVLQILSPRWSQRSFVMTLPMVFKDKNYTIMFHYFY